MSVRFAGSLLFEWFASSGLEGFILTYLEAFLGVNLLMMMVPYLLVGLF